jgi:IS605 OrfB family transposase
MTRIKYRQERTLVRGLQRLPNQDKAEFNKNVLGLRRHFEQFNLNVAELCQWLISFKPENPGSVCETKLFWEFMLEPENFCPDTYDRGPDWLRHEIFVLAAGWRTFEDIKAHNMPESLFESIKIASSKPRSKTAEALFIRLKSLEASHVMVLLKSASEWLSTRYVRQSENWKQNEQEWQKKKAAWEDKHPELTPAIRDKYNAIFVELGISEKRPHVCSWKKLSENKDNCDWAGERKNIGDKWISHSDLCIKYHEFARKLRSKQRQHFVDNANQYLELRRRYPQWTRDMAMNGLFKNVPLARNWFRNAWTNYLNALNILETTILENYSGHLPHCEKLSDECVFKKHTDNCRRYKLLLGEKLSNQERELEETYREWRREFLAPPNKPFLRYPSAQKLPTPKLFGRGYYDLDFTRHVVKLRLDDMPADNFVSFGFKPWPRGYDKKPGEINITSVHVHFIGTRARVGFRFAVPHSDSRFSVSQDKIDELRSGGFPGKSQDQEFLNEARQRLLDGMNENQKSALRIMAVDLGTHRAAAAFFTGCIFNKAKLLKLKKIDLLTEPKTDTTKPEKLSADEKKIQREKGLTQHHVGKHFETLEARTKEIISKRQNMKMAPSDDTPDIVGDHDLRHLTSHIRRMIRDWVRLNARQITELAEEENVDLIVFESMRGFRAPGYDKLDLKKKRRLAFFAYGQIRRKVAEKAVERGMRVITVPYFKSSQICAQCGRSQNDKNKLRDNKWKQSFQCEFSDCNYKTHSDENAARVLGRVFWGEITLPTD